MAYQPASRKLKNGDSITSRGLISNRQHAIGKGPHRFIFRDREYVLAAKVWPNNPKVSWELLEKSIFAEITGRLEEYNGSLEIKIETIVDTPIPANLKDYLPKSPQPIENMFGDLKELVRSITTPSLKALLKKLFGDESFREAFYGSPGAQKMHHSYHGGLLEHSIEVAKFCDAICSKAPELRRDLLITAALLHDIGKTQEINISDQFEYSPTRSGGMLGHVFLGTHRVLSAIENIEGFEPDLTDALCHLLLSHQGKPEWGSPVHPCLPEGYVLHCCDLLSAQYFHCREAFNTSPKNANFQKSPGLSGRIYTGDLCWEQTEDPESDNNFAEIEDIIFPRLQIVDGGLSTSYLNLPLYGSIAAGIPTAEESSFDECIPLSPDSQAREGDYLLKVRGDSMINAHIVEGDLVLVRPNQTVSHRDIVVALVEGESTIKYLYRENGSVFLRAANPEYKDIFLNDESEIQGRVIGVMRGIFQV